MWLKCGERLRSDDKNSIYTEWAYPDLYWEDGKQRVQICHARNSDGAYVTDGYGDFFNTMDDYYTKLEIVPHVD